MKLQLFGCALSAVTLFWGCAEGSKSTTDDFGYNGTGIDFRVSPLTLDSLDDACYSFAVVNGLDQLVVGRGPNVIQANLPDVTGVPATVTAAVCASRFGNSDGGDISYVAPCDASENAKNHTVRLWVNALCRDGGATANTGQGCGQIQDYVNPCPTIGGCSLAVTCLENADVPVTFNFTIMGQADQGFFDIAVNFSDVFCSAKLDTCYDQTPITLLFDNNPTTQTGVIFCSFDNGCNADGSEFNSTNAQPPVLNLGTCASGDLCTSEPGCYDDEKCTAFKPTYTTGDEIPVIGPNPNFQQRVNTAVLGLACTAGADAVDGTYLHMGNVDVTCDGSVIATLELATVTQEGNQAPVNGISWATYYGAESLMTQGQSPVSWNKEYFNIAVAGFGANCSLSWSATVSDGPTLTSATSTGANTYNNYPVITYLDTITGDGGAWLCDQNELNEPGSGVTTGSVECATPGGCIDGPCTTVNPGTGTNVPCDEGPPPPVATACAPGEPVTIAVSKSFTPATLTYMVVADPNNSTPPGYSVVVPDEDANTMGYKLIFNGTSWVASISANNVTAATATSGSTNVAGTYAFADGWGFTVTCGGTPAYACGAYIDEDANGNNFSFQTTLMPGTLVNPPTTSTGWFDTAGLGVYHVGSGNWFVSLPDGNLGDTGVPFNQAVPWGIVSTNGTQGPFRVTISQGPCTPVVIAPAPNIWAVFGLAGTVGIDWRIHTIGDVPDEDGFTNTAAETTGQTGHERPEATHGGADFAVDAIYNIPDNRLYVSNANFAAATPLIITTYQGPASIGLVGISVAQTGQNWTVMAGLAKPEELFLANGFVRQNNATYFLAAQIGERTAVAPAGMNFYILRIDDSAPAVINVTWAGVISPDPEGDNATSGAVEIAADYSAALTAWLPITMSRYRNFWLDPATGRAFFSGPGFAPTQDPASSYSNHLEVNLGTNTVSIVSSVFVSSTLSFHGFLNGGQVAVYTRPDLTTGNLVFGARNLVYDAVVVSEVTYSGISLTSRWDRNFGTYDNRNGLWVSLGGSTAQFAWQLIGDSVGALVAPTLPQSPTNVFNLSQKYNAIATYHNY